MSRLDSVGELCFAGKLHPNAEVAHIGELLGCFSLLVLGLFVRAHAFIGHIPATPLHAVVDAVVAG
jgi:uncharacterized membrane protein YphA (DoxX/SURF4 family)